jgi:hypothetical protein
MFSLTVKPPKDDTALTKRVRFMGNERYKAAYPTPGSKVVVVAQAISEGTKSIPITQPLVSRGARPIT